jgi:peptide/nickel transport system permease protein
LQYFKWISRILQGDLGVSLDWRKPISELIGERLLLTILLGTFTLLLTWALAVPIGIISATRKYTAVDYFFTVFNYIGVATPTFMTALILMWLAFAYLGITITGLFSPEYVDAPWSVGRVVDLGKHIWLPVVILALDGTARLARIMRANLLDELNKPYMEMARAKGMSEWRLVMKYPVRLAINPLVSSLGWYLPLIFSGSLIVATVLNLPTIGQPGHVPGWHDCIGILRPGRHRHAVVRRPAGLARPTHPHGGIGLLCCTVEITWSQADER